MKESFEILHATRALLLKVVKDLSLEEVNKVPPNYNNNIAWNTVHILVTQQLLCYGLSELPMQMETSWIDQFRKGTRTEKALSFQEWDSILSSLQLNAELLEGDYKNGAFKSFKTYPTSYGYTLEKIEDAIQFNNTHEALHLGYIMSLKKALLSS